MNSSCLVGQVTGSRVQGAADGEALALMIQ
jgi:hypothetical protein